MMKTNSGMWWEFSGLKTYLVFEMKRVELIVNWNLRSNSNTTWSTFGSFVISIFQSAMRLSSHGISFVKMDTRLSNLMPGDGLRKQNPLIHDHRGSYCVKIHFSNFWAVLTHRHVGATCSTLKLINTIIF